MSEKTEKKRLSILKVLREAEKPLPCAAVAEELLAAGLEISERTVRFYLKRLDDEGFTESIGRKGHFITSRGREELAQARIIERVGYLPAKINQMTYRMNYDLSTGTGAVIANVSTIKAEQLEDAVPRIYKVFEAGYAMGSLIALFPPGAQEGETTHARGTVGIGTVCSITLNGVLLAHGIPTYSTFGGILELHNHEPRRFVEVIHYDHTTLDPLEIFIRSGMTDYVGATETGCGRIGAGFRELPAETREDAVRIAERLESIGLGGFLTVGWPGQPVVEIPVQHERVGAVVMGGLNPIGFLEEAGIETQSTAMAALVDCRAFFPFQELETRIRNLL
ncbi:MAG: NrpR regulatory domain-containing protein [Candidatus Abyssubacteria bacterium]